jgi:hypothetical protein
VLHGLSALEQTGATRRQVAEALAQAFANLPGVTSSRSRPSPRTPAGNP